MLATIAMQAQITTAWTADLPNSKIPTGVTLADIDTLIDPTVIRFDITLDATTVDNDTAATAFNAIGAATKVELDSNWVQDVWNLNVANDITAVIVIESYHREWDEFANANNYIESLSAAEDVFRIRGKFKYITVPQ